MSASGNDDSRKQTIGAALLAGALICVTVVLLRPTARQAEVLTAPIDASKNAPQAVVPTSPISSDTQATNTETEEPRAVTMQTPMDGEADFQSQYKRALDRKDYRYAGALLLRYKTRLHAGTTVVGHPQLRQDVQLFEDYVGKTPELLKESVPLAEEWALALASLRDTEKLDALMTRLRTETTVLQESKSCLEFYQRKAHAPTDLPRLREIAEHCLQAGADPYVAYDYVGAIIESGQIERARLEYRRYRERFPELPSEDLVFSRM